MSNLVRRDPFAIEDVFDDLLKGFFVRPMSLVTGLPDTRSMPLDVKEGDDAYTIHAELPGVGKDDIHVTLDGNTVTIAAEVKKHTEEKEGEKLLRSERYHGKVSRSFALGREVDETNAKAKFENGVLELMLPKRAETAARRLAIE